jgi:hypothetical protein
MAAELDLSRFGGSPTQATPEQTVAEASEARLGLSRFDRQEVPVAPQIDNTFGEEFIAGLMGGTDNLQMTLYGVQAMVGREMGIESMEKFGIEGAERNLASAQRSGRQSGGFTEIDDAGGFFKWVAGASGELLPSMSTMIASGGVGGVLGKKVVEGGIRKTLGKRVARYPRRICSRLTASHAL